MIFGFEPFGWGPFGFIVAGEDLSEPNPLDSLLRDPLPRRSYIFYGTPFNRAQNQIVTVKLGDGFASRENDTMPDGAPMSHALFRAGLITPYNAQNRVMSGGRISDDPVPGQGDLVFENASGRFRPYLELEWDNAFSQVFLGRPEWALSQFSPIFTGVTGPITNTDTEEIHLPLLDNSYLLRRPLITETYLGSGPCVRYNGTTSYASGSIGCPSGSMTIMFHVRPNATATSQRNIMGWRNGTGAGNRLTDIGRAGTDRIGWAARNDAGTQFTCDAVAATPIQSLTQVAAILDTAASEMRLVVKAPGGIAEIVATTAVTGTWTTTLTAFTLGRLPDSALLYLAADLDEPAVFNRALTLSECAAYFSRQLTGTESGLVHLWHCDEATGSTLFNTVTPGSNSLTLNSTSWVGSLEGGTELAGQTPPLWEGICRQIEPVNVDSQNYVYEVTRNPTVVTVSDVQDKGAASYIMDAPVTDIYSWTPVAGHCVTAYMGGRNLLRLQAAPQGSLTVTVTGDTVDTATIVKKFAMSYGGFTIDQIDLAAFASVASNYPQAVGIGYRLENPEIWEVMQTLARKAGGWVTMTRAGLLTLAILTEPGTPKFHLTSEDIQTNALKRVALSLAVKQTKLSYRPYAKTQSRSELATSLTEAQKVDLGQEKRFAATPVDPTVASLRPTAEVLEEDTLYDLESAAYAEAQRRQALWGVNRATYLLPLTRGLFQYAIGDTVSVTLQSADGTYIENLNEALLVVVAYVEDPKLETMQIEVWGEKLPEPVYLIGAGGEILLASDGSLLVVE